MRRRVIGAVAAAALAAPGVARAGDPPDATLVPAYEEPLPEVGEAPGGSVADRELGASLGVVIGGRTTPGGLRLQGDYLYQLSDLDWFDGIVQFTYGSGAPDCFRDRADELVCDHGPADGVASDLAVGFRRFFAGQQGFRPWVRPALGVRVAHFPDDHVTGFALLVSAAAGVRARVSDTIAVGGQAAVELGGGLFGRGLGIEPQLGLVVAIGVDFALR